MNWLMDWGAGANMVCLIDRDSFEKDIGQLLDKV